MSLSDLGGETAPRAILQEGYREALFAMVPDERPFVFTTRRILAWVRRS
jgi:hypothetical protein